jgi:hypothetical protein
VLFLAEKRAAIDAVTKRLTQQDLGELVLDLHGGVTLRRAFAQLIGRALDASRNAPRLDNGAELQRVERVPVGMLLIRTPGRGCGDRQPDVQRHHDAQPPAPTRPRPRPPVIYASGRAKEPARAAAARPITRSPYATALPSQGVQCAPQATAKGAASGGW